VYAGQDEFVKQQTSATAPSSRLARFQEVAWALAAFAATPFAITGLYRVMPSAMPGWKFFPFALVGTAAVGWGWRFWKWRTVAATVVAAELVWLLVLWWIIALVSGLD
jgi:hypothetical protein